VFGSGGFGGRPFFYIGEIECPFIFAFCLLLSDELKEDEEEPDPLLDKLSLKLT